MTYRPWFDPGLFTVTRCLAPREGTSGSEVSWHLERGTSGNEVSGTSRRAPRKGCSSAEAVGSGQSHRLRPERDGPPATKTGRNQSGLDSSTRVVLHLSTKPRSSPCPTPPS